jgi:hypothetical protein
VDVAGKRGGPVAAVKSRVAMLLALLSLASANAVAFLEKEIVFSEAEVQAALERRAPVERKFGSLVTLAMATPPQISFQRDDGRAGVSARLDVALLGGRPIAVDVIGMAGIRYDDAAKAFFLESPFVESLQSPGLPREIEPAVRQAASQYLAGYVRTRPVYVLRADGPVEERAAHWLLKSVRIERGRVVAVLSPF